MAKISKFDLNWYAKEDYWKEKGKKNLRYLRSLAARTIFLSHSHKDKKMAEGLANLLASMGIDLYIDWQDSDMPGITNRETAEKIKEKIKSSDLVMLLATENSMNSRWVPWEIGVADSSLGESHIVIVPVKENEDKFYGSEYLRLYRRLEYSAVEGLQLFQPKYEHVFDNFSEYLNKME